MLKHFTELAKDLTLVELLLSITSINATLPNFLAEADRHAPYIQKLQAELDANRSELVARIRRDDLDRYLIEFLDYSTNTYVSRYWYAVTPAEARRSFTQCHPHGEVVNITAQN